MAKLKLKTNACRKMERTNERKRVRKIWKRNEKDPERSRGKERVRD